MERSLPPSFSRKPVTKTFRSERMEVRRSKRAVVFDPPIIPKADKSPKAKKSWEVKKDSTKPDKTFLLCYYIVIAIILFLFRFLL